MELAGYIASLLIGISLGLIGGGGSILTVPVLVYLFNIDAVLATTYSLFVVGATSVVGSISFFKRGLVVFKVALIFGLSSIVSVFLTRHFVLPAIPDVLFAVGNFELTKSALLMLLFAVLMLLASISMIKERKDSVIDEPQSGGNIGWLIIEGILIGVLTGLVGAGGGFLIIPTLVNFLKIPIKKAIGTSLVIISANSLSGFAFSLHNTVMQWPLILTLTALAIVGILVGSYLSTFIESKKLKPAFGWFVLVMGIYILIREIFIK